MHTAVDSRADLRPVPLQVDAGGFRDSAVTHSFSKLPSVLSELYSTLPSDTIMLAATLGPFEQGTDWVKDVKRNDEMDRTDRLQGGWFGGKKEAIDMWERETRKVTVLQSAMGRCVFVVRVSAPAPGEADPRASELRSFAAKEQPVWTMAARLNWRKIYVQVRGSARRSSHLRFLPFSSLCGVPEPELTPTVPRNRTWLIALVRTVVPTCGLPSNTSPTVATARSPPGAGPSTRASTMRSTKQPARVSTWTAGWSAAATKSAGRA